MSFPAYPSYRDSGVEWLGNVPAHWNVDRIKASIASSRNGIWGGEPEEADEDIMCVRVADFDRVRFLASVDAPTLRKVSEKEREGRQLQRGDLLLEKSGGGEKQPVGAVVQYAEDVPAVCSNFIARVQLKPDMHSRFWTYVHAAAYSVRLTQGSINQTSGIQNLDSGRYFEERAPFPLLPEQTAIAAFLDRETAKIDALVEEQRRLIELLKEKRQAVISHAVTKGLDPTVPMKDSGVEWLGQVPAHWEACKLGHAAKLQSGYAFASSDFGDIGIPLVRMTNLDRGRLDLSTAVCVPAEKSNERVALNEGDLVWGMSGSIGETGSLGNFARVNREDLPCQLNQRVGRYVVSKGLQTDFLELLIQSESFQKQTILFVTGTAQFNVSAEQVQSIVVAVPPVDEQALIVNSVRGVLDAFQGLLEEAEKSISLFQERRSALISAAVTGKIDVRGVTVRQAVAA